jgi:outer membrane protein assembly factor BamB
MLDGSGVEQMWYTRRGMEERAGAEEMIVRTDRNEPQTRYATPAKRAKYIDGALQNETAFTKESQQQDAHNGFAGGAPVAAAADLAFADVGIASVSSMQGFQGSRIARMKDRNVNTMGDEVIATDPDTGRQLWTYKLKVKGAVERGGFLGTAPVPAGDTVLLATLDGEILRLDAKTGAKRATYAVGSPVRSQPVVDDGWIYVGTEDGKLVAIDTKDRTVTGWPTWGANAQRTGVARPQ